MFPPFGVTGSPLAATSTKYIKGDVEAVPVSLYMIRASTLTPDTDVNVGSAESNTLSVTVLDARVTEVPTIAADADDQYSCVCENV